MAWTGSTRRRRLPPDWAKRRRYVMIRDAGICHVCCQPGADQVDHITPGDNHSLDNLAPIHAHPCHQAKTNAERPPQPTKRRDTEPHPGLLG